MAKLSAREHDYILNRRIIPTELGKVKPAKGQPRVFMLGGQPGAGKSGMTRSIKDALGDDDDDDAEEKNAVVIDMDEFRIYHPKYLEYVRKDPKTAAAAVQDDVSAWAAELYEEALKRRINVIYDGTLGATGKAKDMVASANKAGYAVEVHVVATSLEVSQQAVRSRYEKASQAYEADPINNAPPRNVPDGIQRNAYENIPSTLETLCKTGLVSRMRVASRSGDDLCDLVGKSNVEKNGAGAATQALEKERTRVWTREEIAEYISVGSDIIGGMQRRAITAKEIEAVRKQQRSVVDNKKKELDADEREKDSWVARVVNFDVTTLPRANVAQNVPPNIAQPPNVAQPLNVAQPANVAQPPNVVQPPNVAQDPMPRRRSEPTASRQGKQTRPRPKSLV